MNSKIKNEKILQTNIYYLTQKDYEKIPGYPFCYWVSGSIRNLFGINRSLNNYGKRPNPGLTSDNFRFLRFQWEIKKTSIGINKKWIYYSKGGGYRKWWGNLDDVINWTIEAREFYREEVTPKITDQEYWYQEAATYSSIRSKGISFRYMPPIGVYDRGGPAIIFNNKDLTALYIGILNSKVIEYIIYLLNPTINVQGGDIDKIPLPDSRQLENSNLLELSNKAISLFHKEDFQNEIKRIFVFPCLFNKILSLKETEEKIKLIEFQIDNEVYNLYGLSKEDRVAIEAELARGVVEEEEIQAKTDESEKEEEETLISKTDLAVRWISYAVGIVLGRFHPGIVGEMGSAIYRKSDFAMGSLPEPSEDEFNELVGFPDQFAYTDDQDDRHVFSLEVEKALRALAVSDGIAVLDQNHPRDLPILVEKALILMLGDKETIEVINEGARGDLRRFLTRDFFTQYHLHWYRKRPVYWPIQSEKLSYGFVLFHEQINQNTLFALQQAPYLETKRRGVQQRMQDIQKQLLSSHGSLSKSLERELDELQKLGEELSVFAKALEAITQGGYVPTEDWIDDGVILRMAPMHSLIPIWQNEPHKYWEELQAGEYDWSHIAMHYWPDRVKEKCKSDKSYAIAHGHAEWFLEEKG